MDLWPLVFDVGDVVTGWGEIRDDPDGIWFDPPRIISLGFTHGRRVPRSRQAIRLIDADPAAVATEFSDQGAIPGWTTLTGRWLGQAIAVLAQSPEPPPGTRPEQPRWTEPPCPVPPGGWPVGGEDTIGQIPRDLKDSGAVVTSVLFRPAPDRVVLVVAASDVQRVEERLRPTLGDRLCVVPSRWRKDQLDEVRGVILKHWTDWDVYMMSSPTDDDAQTHIHPSLLRVLPDMASWAESLPDDILQVSATLRPPAAVSPRTDTPDPGFGR